MQRSVPKASPFTGGRSLWRRTQQAYGNKWPCHQKIFGGEWVEASSGVRCFHLTITFPSVILSDSVFISDRNIRQHMGEIRQLLFVKTKPRNIPGFYQLLWWIFYSFIFIITTPFLPFSTYFSLTESPLVTLILSTVFGFIFSASSRDISTPSL